MPPMLPRERCDYSAIVDRPPLKLPGSARLVFWTIVNYEVWDIAARWRARCCRRRPRAADARRAELELARIRHAGRLLALLRSLCALGIKPTLAINARVCEDYPRVAEQAKRDGWEFMGHSYQQGPIHNEPDQKAMIVRTLTSSSASGMRPVGWLGPGLTQPTTRPSSSPRPALNISATGSRRRAGAISTTNGPLVTLPYSVELNDIPMMIVQHHESDYLLKRAIDQFDRLYAEGAERAKIMALAIHPYIWGQPHRIKYLEAIYDYVSGFDGVVHWNGARILDWYRSAPR